jgi:signal transduction histidine kinase
VSEDQVLYDASSEVRQAPVLLFLLAGVALALGVAGDLASCGRIPFLVGWAPLLTGCHYVAIVLAAAGFGPRIGVASALAVGIVHVTVGVAVCGRTVLQGGEAATFVVVGLLAGLVRYPVARKPQTECASEVSPGFFHGFRAPLDAIESAGYVLQEAGLTGENHREVAAIILKECHRLDILTRSLEFVQPRSAVYQTIRMSSLLDEALRMAHHVTEVSSITLRKAEGPDPQLVCDPYLIEQAIVDLLTNATRIVEEREEIVLSPHIEKGDAVIKISQRQGAHLGCIRIPMAAAPEGELHRQSRALKHPQI